MKLTPALSSLGDEGADGAPALVMHFFAEFTAVMRKNVANDDHNNNDTNNHHHHHHNHNHNHNHNVHKNLNAFTSKKINKIIAATKL